MLLKLNQTESLQYYLSNWFFFEAKDLTLQILGFAKPHSRSGLRELVCLRARHSVERVLGGRGYRCAASVHHQGVHAALGVRRRSCSRDLMLRRAGMVSLWCSPPSTRVVGGRPATQGQSRVAQRPGQHPVATGRGQGVAGGQVEGESRPNRPGAAASGGVSRPREAQSALATVWDPADVHRSGEAEGTKIV